MKKATAILIMAIFILSLVPLSLADSSNSGKGSMLSFHDDDDRDDDDRDKIEIKTILRQEKIDDDDLKEREIKDEDKFRHRENLLRNKELFKTGKLKAEEFRIKLETNKGRLKECRANDTESCRLIKRQSFEIAQNYLSNIIDALVNHLKFVKEKLQSSEELTDQEADEQIARVDSLLSKLESLKTKVNAATTRDQLIELSSELKNLMKDVKTDSDFSLERIRQKRIGEILERAEHLEAKLARIQDRFGQNVTNNTELSNLIQQFNDKIDDAREKYHDAVDAFEKAKSANNSDNRHSLVKEAQTLLKSAHQDLKDAHNILKQIFRLLKGIDKDIDFNKDQCWDDRPLFRPGKDLGYFIWQSTCEDEDDEEDESWIIAWSGNARLNQSNTTQTNATNATLRHHMTGTITTNGVFSDVESKKFESGDVFNVTSNNTITFDTYVSTHFDELRFETTGTQVTFDLFVDGERKTSLVYQGKNWTNPSSIPFTMS